MGILKSAADIVYTIRFLKLLVTPFEETDAFKAGIIDENGKRRKDFSMNTMDNRKAYSDHYTAFHRLVYNVKRIMAKAPGGQSVVARYGAALLLIKEHGNLSDSNLQKIHNATGIDQLDMLSEDHKWYILDENKLAPGIYKMKNESVTTDGTPIVLQNDQVRITEENNSPIGDIFGLNIYEAVHIKSRQRLYISTGEIMR